MGDYTDYRIATKNTVTLAYETSSPLVGSRSLKMGDAGSSSAWQIVIVPPATRSQGFTTGRIRGLFQSPTGLNIGMKIGLGFMLSAADITSTSGSGYWWCIEVKAGNAKHDILYKTTTGLDNISSLVDLSSSFPTSTQFSMEIRWSYNPMRYEGLYIQCYRGTDFTDLTLRTTYRDTSPLTTSVSEGIIGEATQNGATWYFYSDTWQVEETFREPGDWPLFERHEPTSDDTELYAVRPGLVGETGMYLADEGAVPGCAWAPIASMPTALTKGKIVAWVDAGGLTGTKYAGFAFLQDQRRLVDGSGAAYGVVAEYDITAPRRRVDILKLSTGLASPTVLANSSNTLLPAHGTPYWIEVLFEADMAKHSGTKIEAYWGVAADYSDRALAVTHTDTTSPLLTSSGMSIYVYNGGGDITYTVEELTIDNFAGF